MYKEQWGGERFVDYSLSHSYTISGTLLHQWPSRQRYDAEVEAITAGDVASINQTGLIAPTKPPTPPTNLTIYATQQVPVNATFLKLCIYCQIFSNMTVGFCDAAEFVAVFLNSSNLPCVSKYCIACSGQFLCSFLFLSSLLPPSP